MSDPTFSTPQTLLLPTREFPIAATPSGLTPNTRSEAEAALTHNTSAQTDSAAPTTPAKPYPRRNAPDIIRASSTNYEDALREAHMQASASSDLEPTSPSSSSLPNTESPLTSTLPSAVPFPAPGEGVVPRNAGVAAGQAEMVRKAKPTGLSLGDLGRKQSWSGQDFKHVMQAPLMGEIAEDERKGYESNV